MQRIAPDARPPSTQQWPLITTLQPFDVYFVDQLSVGIPFLRWLTNTRVVFYCHFPDLLMNPNRVGQPSLLRTIYRLPLDWLEQSTTGTLSPPFFGNSNDHSRRSGRQDPRQLRLYRKRLLSDFSPIGSSASSRLSRYTHRAFRARWDNAAVRSLFALRVELTSRRSQLTLLSINRFEGKKNLALAIEAFSQLRNQDELQLILAGAFASDLLLLLPLTEAKAVSTIDCKTMSAPCPPSATSARPSPFRTPPSSHRPRTIYKPPHLAFSSFSTSPTKSNSPSSLPPQRKHCSIRPRTNTSASSPSKPWPPVYLFSRATQADRWRRSTIPPLVVYALPTRPPGPKRYTTYSPSHPKRRKR